MGVGRPRRHSSSMDEVDDEEFWETDLQLAINDSSRRTEASFTIRIGIVRYYQQFIPMDFARCHKILGMKSVTLEGPTRLTWSTVIRPFHEKLYFGKGWRQFFIENHLQEGYQLMFTLVPRFRFLVQFFDHLGKRCTTYPPLPVTQLGTQPVVDGRKASHRPEASLPHERLRVPTFDPRNDSEDMTSEDEETEALLEDNNDIFLDSDNDHFLFCHPPATKPPLVKPEHKTLTLNELMLRKNLKCNQATQMKKVKKPITRKKVTLKRRSPAAPPVAGSHKVGASSGSSPAMRLLQQQGCMRFSDVVSKCERRDVSNRERLVVQGAAKRFASKLGNEKFLVVMRDAQVYQGFHLVIPDKIVEATGTERASKVEVCLLDREQALYKGHWTRQNVDDTPLLDRDAWAKFAVDHTLEEGDVCVFELFPQPLQSKPAVSVATFFFLVHIFRVVETPLGQLHFSDAYNRQ